MPYTLLDQAPLDDALPRCAERGIGIVIGSPYASGILATGAVAGAQLQLRARPPPEILEQTRAHRGGLPAPWRARCPPRPAVPARPPGGRSDHPGRGRTLRGRAQRRDDAGRNPRRAVGRLKAEGLLHPDAPVPA